MTTSPGKTGKTAPLGIAEEAPDRTVMEAYKFSSFYRSDPEPGFGTGTRPPLYQPGGGPGPGAYPIKSTMFKLMESHIRSPSQFSIRGRTKFGDPNERSMSKTAKNEPGPGNYDLTGKFIAGRDPRNIVFAKAKPFEEKAALSPGPGSYQFPSSLGKQVLSTSIQNNASPFPRAARGSMAVVGASDIGPGEYGPAPAACEKQVESVRPTCGSIKFGTGYRKSDKNSKTMDLSEPSPGPGSYYLPGGIATKATGSPYRSSPQATISGRNKFGSPF